jgi:hypothetical protein
MLLEAVTRLAADAQEQEQYLRQQGTWPSLDELVLDLDDVERAATVPAEAVAPLRRLSEKLDAMSGPANSRLWGPDALSDPEWNDVRLVAADALTALRGHS